MPVTVKKIKITWMLDNYSKFFEYICDNFPENDFFARKSTQYLVDIEVAQLFKNL